MCQRCVFDHVTAKSAVIGGSGIMSGFNDGSNFIIGCSGEGFTRDITMGTSYAFNTQALNSYKGQIGLGTHGTYPSRCVSDYYAISGTGTIRWYASQVAGLPAGWINSGDNIYMNSADEWYEWVPGWCPGFSGFSAVNGSMTVWSSSITTQYRLSNDFGRTWDDWRDLTTSNVLLDTPDPVGLFAQLRCKRDNMVGGINTTSFSSAAITATADKYNAAVPYRDYLKLVAAEQVNDRMVD
jgi:hypothetical protein